MYAFLAPAPPSTQIEEFSGASSAEQTAQARGAKLLSNCSGEDVGGAGAAQVVTVEGMEVSRLPFSGPKNASPVTCSHRESVCRSYMTNAFSNSVPL